MRLLLASLPHDAISCASRRRGALGVFGLPCYYISSAISLTINKKPLSPARLLEFTECKEIDVRRESHRHVSEICI